MFRKPNKRELFYLLAVIILYATGVIYAFTHNLSMGALFKYGLLQPKGIMGEEARLTEIETTISWNIPKTLWYIYIKGAAILVELLQYWIVGMLIAALLVVFVSWEAVKKKMGFGGFKANFLATTLGAIIPICSCGIVPVLAGMVQAGIPLGPTMAFLIAAPMLNVPTVFITAGVLGWGLAVGRIIATFGIALAVGHVLSYWQRKERSLKNLIKIYIPPRLSPEMQQFCFQLGMVISKNPGGVSTEDVGLEHKERLVHLEELGLVQRNKQGKWQLVERDLSAQQNACFVLPTGDVNRTFTQKIWDTFKTTFDLFLQLNYYLVLAVIIAGAIKVLIPTNLIVGWLGGKTLNSVLVASFIAVLAYVCTYVEVPTALALMSKGMGGGATLAYLLGGPGLSLPSIMMLSAVFRKKPLALYVLLSFIGCVVAGYVFNMF